MKSNQLWNYVIGSILLHIVLIIVATKLPKATQSSAHTVETFMVESPVARTVKQTQQIPTKLTINTDRHTEVVTPIQSIPHGKQSAPQDANKNALIKIPTSNNAPDSVFPLQAKNITPVSVALNSYQASAPPQENSKPPVSTRQSYNSAPAMVMGETGSPRFIHKEAPIYPFMARKLGKEGKVVLSLALNDQGKLQRLETIEANGFGFAEAASAAIRKSTFAPAVKNGMSMTSQVLVTVRFVLKEAQ
ncbi:MAG: TonB family protein [Desulfuromonadaceae bacterium]|nr:TonB family protein [Desulfuromonadaceae bacterium]